MTFHPLQRNSADRENPLKGGFYGFVGTNKEVSHMNKDRIGSVSLAGLSPAVHNVLDNEKPLS
jgi:hypothetical protein